MSSGTEAWDRLLSPRKDPPEVAEQLLRLKEKEDRDRRLAWALFFVLLGAVFMVSGALLIGDQHYDYGWEEFRWYKWQLEIGILLSLLGTIVVTVTVVYLLPPFRR
ncbi:MAG TPA: hypothetical protein VJ489_01735 [Thermoplasmata archaeon]|nr:hypothetical protein [Thermoplasmata archaeon]